MSAIVIRLLLLLALGLAAQGCGDSRGGSSGSPPAIDVVYDTSLTSAQRAQYAHDVATVVSAWEADHGQKLAPLTIEISYHLLPCQNVYASGCAFLAERRVLVHAEPRLWQLYHEFCHVGLGLYDYDHQDPRWGAWNLRGMELVR